MNPRSPVRAGGDSGELAGTADFRLGNCLVRPSLRCIAGPLGVATLEPRVMRVLVAFAEAGANVLNRDALMHRCWDGAVVGNDAINRTVAEIRRIAREIGGDFGIGTIARVGYRLEGQVQPTVPAGDPPPPAAPAATQAPPRYGRRAVLAASLATVAALGAAGFMAWRGAKRDARFAAHMTLADQALRHLLPGGARVARDALQEAIALRDDEPRAWGLLALAHYQLSEGMGPPPVRRRIRGMPRGIKACWRCSARSTWTQANPRRASRRRCSTGEATGMSPSSGCNRCVVLPRGTLPRSTTWSRCCRARAMCAIPTP